MTRPDDPRYADDRLMTAADREPDSGLREPGMTTAAPDAAREPAATTGDVAPGTSAGGPLVAQEAAVDYRARWEVIQQGFVDDPRNAVSEADKLVDDLLKHLSDGFDRQHHDLEKRWSDGEPSTEDLRSALQRYRAFFQRLLAL